MNSICCILALPAVIASCSLEQSKSEQPIVRHNAQSAAELQGRQHQTMTNLNLTSSEQAAVAHNSNTQPVDSVKYSTEAR